MADNIEHLMLEQFRQMRSQMDRMEGELREVKMGIISLTHHKRGIEWTQEAHGEAIEGLKKRLVRVERRLELSEPDATSPPSGLSEDSLDYRPLPPNK